MTRLRSLLISLLIPCLLIVGWEIVSKLNLVPSTMLAPPEAVASDLVTLTMDGSLWHHASISLTRLFTGFLVGAIFGIITGVMLGVSRLFSRLFEPTFAVLAPVPPVAWVPFLIMLFGIDDLSKVLLIALGTFFIVTVHAAHGIRSTGQEYVELARVLNKRKDELLLFILLPSALPDIFTGMRVSLGLCWTLLLVSEIIASSEGLGWLIWDARNFSRSDDLIAGMIAVGLLGRLSDMLMAALERRATLWRFTYESAQTNVS